MSSKRSHRRNSLSLFLFLFITKTYEKRISRSARRKQHWFLQRSPPVFVQFSSLNSNGGWREAEEVGGRGVGATCVILVSSAQCCCTPTLDMTVEIELNWREQIISAPFQRNVSLFSYPSRPSLPLILIFQLIRFHNPFHHISTYYYMLVFLLFLLPPSAFCVAMFPSSAKGLSFPASFWLSSDSWITSYDDGDDGDSGTER